MVVPVNVKLVKFVKLDEVDKGLFEGALERFFKKIGSGSNLVLSLKEYKKGGLRSQHEVHAKLILNGHEFFTERKGWLLLEVVQDTLKVLEREVKKKDSFSK
ncbi:MAG: hypothetical protein WCI04_04285 [archaeon]